MAERVLILHTGGTLGMQPREPDQALAPGEFGATVLEHVPELTRIADIDTRMLFNLDSSDLAPNHWMELARAMPFPVILTGSQRPLADVHSDGRANLVGAVDLALRPIPEVSIYFDGLLLRGNRAVKYSTFAFGAYQSPSFPPLAEVGTELRLEERPLQPSGAFRLEGHFDDRVAVVWLHPGDDGSVLSGLVDSDTVAVLVAGFGYGNIPVADRRVAEAIRALTQAGKVVAIGSQSPSASVDLTRYSGGRLAQEGGATGIGDMTTQAAAVKLMYLSAILDSPDAVKKALLVPIAGEISP
jgi:L-asparaginase